MNSQDIISLLPYAPPFLFVDELVRISEDGVEGTYTYDEDEFYFKGHFKDNPVTPGVILTETMAQIGLVCLGIFLTSNDADSLKEGTHVALTAHQVDFFKPVYPGDKVTVISEKDYFRFNKLKCKVRMESTDKELIAKGTIAGMIIHETDV